MDTRPIGIFDSGVGGLTVVDKMSRLLPDEKIIYFGDTARVPYGNKSKETVTRFSKEIVDFLRKFKVKLIIVACNTASSLSLNILERSFPVPIVGVITPGVREAVKESPTQRIGVIGTESTVNSKSYEKEIKFLSKKAHVFQKACLLFVPLAENNWLGGEITEKISKEYLSPLVKKKIDTIILGCTHYPLLKKVIQKTVGKKIKLIDSSEAVARYTKDLLERKHMRNNSKKKRIQFFASDNTRSFTKLAKVFLGKNIKSKRAVL